ncbi:M56 family metallopeptidase [Streptomyces sp. NPDC055025]
MNAASALIGYSVVVGLVVPRLLLRGTWIYRAPALGAAVWQALSLSFSVAATLTASSLAVPTEHLHAGLVGILHSCGLHLGPGRPDPGTADRLAIALPSAMALALAASFVFHLVRARRLRERHRDTLDLVGRHSARLRATVLPYDLPAAYCLPGRRPRVVVSEAAVRDLSPEQLDAVLEHERAHITGRHHLALAAVEAFHSLFPWLPLARLAKEQTALLMEMAADDRALRSHSHEVLATAMYEMAAARAPKGALAVGGETVVIRLRRILARRGGPHPVVSGTVATVAAVVPVLPLLLACPPVLG